MAGREWFYELFRHLHQELLMEGLHAWSVGVWGWISCLGFGFWDRVFQNAGLGLGSMLQVFCSDVPSSLVVGLVVALRA